MTRRRKINKDRQSLPINKPRGRAWKKSSFPSLGKAPASLEKEIIAYMHKQRRPLAVDEIINGLDLDRTHRKKLLDLLGDLCRHQYLVRANDKRKVGRYALVSADNLVEAQIAMHPRGFGFAIIQPPPGADKPAAGQKRNDPYISPDDLGSANHGDRVLVRLHGRRGSRMEARVVRIIERATVRLPGIYTAGRLKGLVVPEDDRLTYNVLISRENAGGAKNGEAVLVEIISFKAGRQNPEGRIIRVLGAPDSIAVQTEVVISKFRLPDKFSDESLQTADRLPAAMPDEADRVDLRDIAHVTIDGESARDFDDAVAVSTVDNVFRLYVSIADVSHFVQPGTPLDLEAYQRGTSVYFPDRVLPMLPERLSNDLCSLVPDQDRLAFTAVMDFDRQGRRLKQQFMKSIIRSRYRLTYNEVRQVLEDNDPPAEKKRRQYASVMAGIKEMAVLAAALEQRRQARGSIGFALPEAELIIDAAGKVSAVNRAQRNLAHKLIEEFMLAANEAVAETLAGHKQPALYRIHEEPDAEKIREFTEFARAMGLSLPRKAGTPAWFGEILAQAAGTPREYIVSNLLLRSMQRARYSMENLGHFGLAASHYLHFTSPIRRYPDLAVHRALAALLASLRQTAPKGKKPEPKICPAPLAEAGDFLSGREKTSVDAERELNERMMVRFMADRVGEVYTGVVSGVTPFGLFIELLEFFVSGAVPMDKLTGDYFQLDEKNHRLIGARTGREYQLGELVRVRVDSVEVRQRHINFSIEI